MIIRVSAPLLQGLIEGEYDIDDPRLKGRGRHWVAQGMVEIVSGAEPDSYTVSASEAEPDADTAPKKRGRK